MLEKTKIKRYYYHLTTKRWPINKTLSPRNWGEIRPREEPDDERICVAPSFVRCYLAIPMEYICEFKYPNLYLYRTKEKVFAHRPYGVEDSSVTDEKWLMEKTNFVRVNVLDTLFLKDNFPQKYIVGDRRFNSDARSLRSQMSHHFDTEGHLKNGDAKLIRRCDTDF